MGASFCHWPPGWRASHRLQATAVRLDDRAAAVTRPPGTSYGLTPEPRSIPCLLKPCPVTSSAIAIARIRRSTTLCGSPEYRRIAACPADKQVAAQRRESYPGTGCPHDDRGLHAQLVSGGGDPNDCPRREIAAVNVASTTTAISGHGRVQRGRRCHRGCAAVELSHVRSAAGPVLQPTAPAIAVTLAAIAT